MVQDSFYWDNALKNIHHSHLQGFIAQYKREEHIRLVSGWTSDKKSKKVLKTDLFEEAFGKDLFFDFLAENFNKAVGIDISGKVVSRSRENLKSIGIKGQELLVRSVISTGFKDKSFDCIISNSTLDHLSKEDMIKALQELRRILKDDGEIILTIDNKDNPLYYLGYIISNRFRLQRYRQNSCYSQMEMKNMLTEQGYVINDITSIVSIPTPFNRIARFMESARFPSSGPVIQALVRIFDKHLRGRITTGWFLAFRLSKH
ncbi:MAG: class I SAM-dependent methyltransferase [archaeon]